MGVGSRLVHAYNAFLNRNPVEAPPLYTGGTSSELGVGSSMQPMRARFGIGGERSITASIYLRLAMDCASVDIRHVRLDDQQRYVSDIQSGLNNCLNVEANLDQTARAFMQDVYMTLFEAGDLAILPVDTASMPGVGGMTDIYSWRVGRVTQWYPQHVRVEAYNELTGRREEVVVPKREVGLVENPLYAVMNEPNSTLQRLHRKLSLLDVTDEKMSSGKLDMLIQLPYPMRNEARRQDAEQRRSEIEMQLTSGQHGIAYIDATEKVIQLNRPVENNLLKQVEYLLDLLYTQLGLTPAVMNGTAPESELLNYNNRTTEPVISAVADEIRRKFLTPTARTQGQDIRFFRDPFKLVPMKDLAELADKFTRNEIVTSNEFRGFIGMRPKEDPKADMLTNSNIPFADTRPEIAEQALGIEPGVEEEDDVVEGEVVSEEEDFFAETNAVLDEVFQMAGVEE